MARPRAHLARAPIVEAVIDFRVLRRPDVRVNELSQLLDRLGPGFQPPTPIKSIFAAFGVQAGSPPLQAIQTESNIGWAYKGESAIAQFRLDGFTYNKLEPYTAWEDVFGAGLRLWNLYQQAARPIEISRIAVRYINRLRLPGPAELEQYLESRPVLPPPIPQSVREYLTRVVVDDKDRRASAVITQALEASLDPTVVPVLVDIDAFKEGSLSVDETDNMRSQFQELRSLKNSIFFASLTERAVEMYA